MKTSISSEALSQFGAEKIAFPQKPDIRTDISNYRIASLLLQEEGDRKRKVERIIEQGRGDTEKKTKTEKNKDDNIHKK